MKNKLITKPFRVMTYNIRKTRGLDGRKDAGRILDILNKSDADVIALQEADFRLGDRPTAIPFELIESATDFEVAPVAMNGVSLGWHGNAILLRKGVTIVSADRLTLPGLEPRGSVLVKLANGVSIVGVHLGLSRISRRKQLTSIVKELSMKSPTLILGDFNEWSSNKGLEPLLNHFDVHAPGRSFHASRPIAALDRIATSNGLELLDAGVIDNLKTRVASDHLPVWADLEFSGML